MLTRRFMPPEYVSTLALALSVRPICSSTSSTRCFKAEPLMPYMRPQKMRFSRALSMLYKAMSCGTTPITSRTFNDSRVTECPPMMASPLVGLSRHDNTEIVVVLPAPLGPSRLKISPASMAKLTSSTAVASPYFLIRC